MVKAKELKKEWPSFVMLPLDVIGNFVDVVSYVRLFAVGSASLAVAEAFNDMALAKGINGPVAGLIAAFILFGGHALNIILAAMGILVHGVRLNTLEFSGHIGMQWTGKKFTPFSTQNTNK
jgi:V/A-type H+-transporting ATPase subunit I